jgi:hypothetical protein
MPYLDGGVHELEGLRALVVGRYEIQRGHPGPLQVWSGLAS